MKKARLFILYYYLYRHIIYTLSKKDYLHFKVKANLMDHHVFLTPSILRSLRFYGVVVGGLS